MKTGRSSSPTQPEFASTNLIKEQLLQSLQTSKDYRHAFVQERIASRLTAQIESLRHSMNGDYKQFADKIGKKVSWAYRLEDPNAPPPTIPTLLQIAESFDIGVDVRFCRFTELVDDVSKLTPHSFAVPSFNEEIKSGAFWTPTKRRLRNIPGRKRRGQLTGKIIDIKLAKNKIEGLTPRVDDSAYLAASHATSGQALACGGAR
jgi:hypothetical protein